MSENAIRTPETEPVAPSPAQQVRSDWRALMSQLSYKAVINNITFLSFIALLCVVYISSSHRAVSLQRQISRSSDTLDELRWQYWAAKSKLIGAKKEDVIMRTADSIGLKPSILPAYKISSQ
jgi:hypothetical protein